LRVVWNLTAKRRRRRQQPNRMQQLYISFTFELILQAI
jgi:hypothetical protein